MDDNLSRERIHSIWSDDDSQTTECCVCDGGFTGDEVLFRTVSIKAYDETEQRCTRELNIPSTDDVLRIFCRHLDCAKEVEYVAISHVWPTPVAEYQHQRRTTKASIGELATLLLKTPAQIYRGIHVELGHRFEIWHDYVSVPQWVESRKMRIIRAIPDIFWNAKMTVAHLDDVTMRNFQEMRVGATQQERVIGISDICNSKWLSRMWTAMEHTHSHDVRAMVNDFRMVEADPQNRSFPVEMRETWQVEVWRHGFALDLEHIAGIGHGSLVPWQLGPIDEVRPDGRQDKRPCFAVAHTLLSRRRVTIQSDFFHALVNILQPLPYELLSAEPKEALLQLARARLRAGDFSSLLMIPEAYETELEFFDFGFNDLKTFGLGSESKPPLWPQVQFHADSKNITVKLEEIGEVVFVRRFRWGLNGAITHLVVLCRLTLDATGVDIDAFVKTIGSRLYGVRIKSLQKRLSSAGRRERLKELVEQLYETCREDCVPIVEEMAEIMGLSNKAIEERYHQVMSPMNFMLHHGGSMHHADSGSIVAIRCSGCQRMFLLRITLLCRAAGLLGLKAYRIPGLRYHFTLKGGTGFLLKDGRMVGRFIWGTPTCDCEKLRDTTMTLDDLPLPRPNNKHYGRH